MARIRKKVADENRYTSVVTSAKKRDELLLNMALTGYISRATAHTLYEDADEANKRFKSLEKSNYIEHKKRKVRIDGREKIVEYFYLKEEGLYYLKERYNLLKYKEENEEWEYDEAERTRRWKSYVSFMENVHWSLGDFRVIANGTSIDKERIIKQLAYADATSFAYALGASIRPCHADMTKKDTDGNTLHEIIERAVGDAELNPESEYKYTHAKIIKQKAQEEKSFTIRFIQRCRFIGILETPDDTLLWYVGTNGFNWRSSTVQGEATVYNRYMDKHSRYDRSKHFPGINVALLVENVKMFDDIINDNRKIRTKKENNNDPLGTSTRQMLVFPKTHEGVENMRLYLEHGGAIGYKNKLIKYATEESDVYRKNEDNLRDFFPMLSEQDDTYLYIGCMIDVNDIRRLQKKLRDHHEKVEYRIVCYDWQIEYYKRILKPVGFDTLPMDLI